MTLLRLGRNAAIRVEFRPRVSQYKEFDTTVLASELATYVLQLIDKATS